MNSHKAMTRALVGLIVVLLVGCAAGTHGTVSAVKKNHSDDREPAAPADFERHLVRLINEERGRQRLAPLTFSPLLARAAENHSRDMARYNFFSHNNPAGQGTEDRISRAGYRWRAYGENIGCGHNAPEKIMAAWMKSSNHRDNVLSPSYSEIGVGFFRGGECRYYWTALFGRPR